MSILLSPFRSFIRTVPTMDDAFLGPASYSAFKWNTQINVSIDRNKAAKLGTNDTPIGGFNNQEDYNRTAVGKPLGMFYGYVYDGVFMTEAEYEAGPKHASSIVGTVRMKDLNGDNKIDMDDRTYIGNPNPDFTFGITNEFSWRNFDASLLLTGSVGNAIGWLHLYVR